MAVLLVNSVINEVIRAIRIIIVNKLKILIISINFEISSANPVVMINDAIDKPPPNRTKTFHGIFLYQSKRRIDEDPFNGKIKNKRDPKIAIEASVKPISKNLFIYLLKIHKLIVKKRINIEIFSDSEILPKLKYFF